MSLDTEDSVGKEDIRLPFKPASFQMCHKVIKADLSLYGNTWGAKC